MQTISSRFLRYVLVSGLRVTGTCNLRKWRESGTVLLYTIMDPEAMNGTSSPSWCYKTHTATYYVEDWLKSLYSGGATVMSCTRIMKSARV